MKDDIQHLARAVIENLMFRNSGSAMWSVLTVRPASMLYDAAESHESSSKAKSLGDLTVSVWRL